MTIDKRSHLFYISAVAFFGGAGGGGVFVDLLFELRN